MSQKLLNVTEDAFVGKSRRKCVDEVDLWSDDDCTPDKSKFSRTNTETVTAISNEDESDSSSLSSSNSTKRGQDDDYRVTTNTGECVVTVIVVKVTQ